MMQAKRCKKCRIEKRSSGFRVFNNKLSRICKSCLNKYLGDCRKLAIEKGGLFLSNEYINNKTKYRWKCQCGYEWMATPFNIQNRTWCPSCAGNIKYTQKQVKDDISNRGGELLSQYKNRKSKITVRCNDCGNNWEVTYGNVLSGNWCPHCRLNKYSLSDVAKIVCDNGGELLSSYKNSREKIFVICKKCNTIWSPRLQSILLGSWCPKCSGKIKKTIDDAANKANEMGGKLLSKKYINSITKMRWRCGDDGHEWENTFAEINRGSWCPKCSSGKSQKLLKNVLECLLLEDSQTIRPCWLVSADTGGRLEIDIYFSNLKLAVEYQGEQHFMPIDFAGKGNEWARKNFDKITNRDEIKRNLIKKNKQYVNYYIEFPYFEEITEENVIKYLLKNNVPGKIIKRGST